MFVLFTEGITRINKYIINRQIFLIQIFFKIVPSISADNIFSLVITVILSLCNEHLTCKDGVFINCELPAILLHKNIVMLQQYPLLSADSFSMCM